MYKCIGNVVWFDRVSAARALLKLSRAVDDADFEQFIGSSAAVSSKSGEFAVAN